MMYQNVILQSDDVASGQMKHAKQKQPGTVSDSCNAADNSNVEKIVNEVADNTDQQKYGEHWETEEVYL